MCGIMVVAPRGKYQLQKGLWEDCLRVFANNAERGRDSWGLVSQDNWAQKNVGRFGQYGNAFLMPSDMMGPCNHITLGNTRAEPTTEYVKDKTSKDIQPFVYHGWHVTHNGTISNDHELAQRFDLTTKREQHGSQIDSWIIAGVLSVIDPGGKRFKQDPSFLDKALLPLLKGSYAFAVTYMDTPHYLYAATNYKPLFMGFYKKRNGALILSSVGYEMLNNPNFVYVRELPGYCSVTMNNNVVSVRPHRGSMPLNEKAVVIASGGLDSTVAYAIMKSNGYKSVDLLHMDYGCKANKKEMEAVENIAQYYAADYYRINIPLYYKIEQKNNPLLHDVPISGGEAGAEFAHEWVPARNLLMIANAVAWAEGSGYNAISSGVNLEEAGAYPDNEPAFIERLDELLHYAVGPDKHISLVAPVGNMMKHEIVKAGMDLGVPFELTWSCYKGGDTHCGDCGPCYMRKKAFEINGAKDPVFA